MRRVRNSTITSENYWRAVCANEGGIPTDILICQPARHSTSKITGSPATGPACFTDAHAFSAFEVGVQNIYLGPPPFYYLQKVANAELKNVILESNSYEIIPTKNIWTTVERNQSYGRWEIIRDYTLSFEMIILDANYSNNESSDLYGLVSIGINMCIFFCFSK